MEKHLSNRPHDNTPEKCAEGCAAASSSYKYFGLGNGEECWCTAHRSYDKHGKVADSECSKLCPGNKNVKCGAPWRSSVFEIKSGLCPPTLCAKCLLLRKTFCFARS